MEKKERFKLIPEVYLIFVRNNKILLSRRFQTGYEDGNYSMIAGHADGNETMREALAREAEEEGGIKIDPAELRHVLTMHRYCKDHERIGFYFTVDKFNGEIKNKEPNKCDDLSWFPLSRIPKNTIPYIRFAIDCYSTEQRYCEFGWDR
ncbi:MAG: NUDIX domain-containing protein [Candidatus Paceibacterota bacterium]|nr:NUDIX domain-containing protein [Candidatus Paceibacterota bacterium]MDD4467126.1 NUDIX domain-containing protein [Candidatus Paceibacterota bacterium]MDD4897683.1 NUDIX domain-containing protein [Candidatus Paceibacterota bacterium]